jgi:hypothetical protein
MAESIASGVGIGPSGPPPPHSALHAQICPAQTLTATLLDFQSLDDYLLRTVLSKAALVLSSNNNASATASKDSWLWPVLQFGTLLATLGQTPAVRLLGLQADTAGGIDPSSHDFRNRKRAGLLKYSILGILLPFVYRKLKQWTTAYEINERQRRQRQQDDDIDDTSLSETQRLARKRQHAVTRLLVRAVDTLLPPVQILLLLTCWSGISQKPPDLATLLAGWRYRTAQPTNSTETDNAITDNATARLASTGTTPRLHVDFAHRRWLYECLMQTSRVWLAGLHILQDTWQSDVQDYLVTPARRLVLGTRQRFFPKRQEHQQRQQQQYRQHCPLCRRSTVPLVPVRGNCSCEQTFCYTCLHQQSTKAAPFYCPTCGDCITVGRFVHCP